MIKKGLERCEHDTDHLTGSESAFSCIGGDKIDGFEASDLHTDDWDGNAHKSHVDDGDATLKGSALSPYHEQVVTCPALHFLKQNPLKYDIFRISSESHSHLKL